MVSNNGTIRTAGQFATEFLGIPTIDGGWVNGVDSITGKMQGIYCVRKYKFYLWDGTQFVEQGGGKNRLAMLLSDTLTEVTEDDFHGAPWIGGYQFCSKENLQSVVIPNRISSIGAYAFSECTSLSSVVIGSGVTRIGGHAFYNCKLLATVVLKSNSIAELMDNDIFTNTPFATGSGVFYVPQALIESYKTATGFRALYEAGTCDFVAIEGSEYE
jgi:hypothetical protein